MHILRSTVLATLLLAAPLQPVFAQGAPPAAGAKAPAPPAAGAKAPAPPAAGAKASATPAATAPAASQYEISTEIDAAMTEKAQALFKEGNAHFRDAKYPQAQASYKAAWALDLRSQKVVRNLGLTELELKKYRDAAEHLTIALRLSEPNDPKRAKMQSEIAQARAQVGAVTLKLNVDGVEIVQMDTGRAYMTPLVDPMFVEPGKVGFRIRREGYESQEKVFDLKAGQELSEEVVLVRPPYGTTTATPTSTTAPPSTPRSKVPAFVLGGLGVAGLVAGGALVGVAVGKQGENRENAPKDKSGNPTCERTAIVGEDPQCKGLRSNTDSANTLGNAGIGVLVGGGVLLAAGVVYWLIPSKKSASDSKSASRVLPVVSSEGGGLLWTGSF